MVVTESPPDHWQYGAKYPVLIHVEEIHDYTTATIDLSNPDAACEPTKRQLSAWHLGVVDGEQPPPRAFDGPHPLPPRTQDREEDERRNDECGCDRTRGVDRDRERGNSRRNEGRRYNDDHPDELRGQGWRRHDRDDDRDGRDGGDTRGGNSSRRAGLNGVRHRTCSPRRRDSVGGNCYGRRHHEGARDPVEAAEPLAPVSEAKRADREVSKLKVLYHFKLTSLQWKVKALTEKNVRDINDISFDFASLFGKLKLGAGGMKAGPKGTLPRRSTPFLRAELFGTSSKLPSGRRPSVRSTTPSVDGKKMGKRPSSFHHRWHHEVLLQPSLATTCRSR